ncbi:MULTISPECIES: transcription antitermination factor NusB [Clostridiaceae]|mgnify:CR=1 FL=1|uniref:Transcription antitermination protein NusB n=1 Tax=Clostridium facile TaxID=2763035 RepID=A0ABR7IQA0_9CLOT|nr:MULTISPECIES: transcription antitermination factor NusB [Clostridiaceae]MBC5787298.1 transcription antitermination factor NusB [Clostridium facile]
MKRHEIRENAFVLVFEKIFNDDDLTQIVEIAKECDDLQVNEEVIRIVTGVQQHVQELDAVISEHLTKWSISRLSKVVLAILRLAVYEILFEDAIEPPIAINEAVELAKTYASQEDAAFINGVLGGFVRKLEEK